MPKVSIVIPTHNEEKDIEACLKSLLNQSYKNFEIIVVDDGSTDKTRDMVKKLSKKSKKIRLIEGQHKGPGFSRNLGAKKARGSILVFVDADMTFDKDYVKNLIKPIIKNNVIGTEEAIQIASNKNNIWSRCWGTYFKRYKDMKEGKIFRAIKKDIFLKFKGFDPSLGYADDLTFYIKYGLKSFRVLNAICYHKNPETLKEVYKQSRWIGASLNNIFLKIPIVKYFIPFFMILLFPIMILILSIKKCYQIKNFKLFFPWMLIFMTVRYAGTISGIFRKTWFGINVR